MSDHVSERGATCGAQKKKCCTVHGCVNEHGAGFFFFFFFSKRKRRQSGYQQLFNECVL